MERAAVVALDARLLHQVGLLALVLGVSARSSTSLTSTTAAGGSGWSPSSCAIVLVVGWIKRIDTHYTVTNQRINIRHGIFSRADHATSYERLQNVKTYQSLVERMLGVGMVDFDTAAGDDFDFKFTGIDGSRGPRAPGRRAPAGGDAGPLTQRRHADPARRLTRVAPV